MHSGMMPAAEAPMAARDTTSAVRLGASAVMALKSAHADVAPAPRGFCPAGRPAGHKTVAARHTPKAAITAEASPVLTLNSWDKAGSIGSHTRIEAMLAKAASAMKRNVRWVDSGEVECMAAIVTTSSTKRWAGSAMPCIRREA